MVEKEFHGIRYIRRNPMLKSSEHFIRCIDEADTEYFCLFHDDDVMLPTYVEEVMLCAKDYPGAVAIGCNANVERFGKLETQSSFRSFRKHEIIISPNDLAKRYFSRAQSGIAPFPGYVYKRTLVDKLRPLMNGGKYADVTWLLNLAMSAPVVWISVPLITYRLHESNDGNTESLRDRLRFFGFLKQNANYFSTGLMKDYRSFVYKKILNEQKVGNAKRLYLLANFMRCYRLSRYTRPAYYKALVIRSIVKLAEKK